MGWLVFLLGFAIAAAVYSGAPDEVLHLLTFIFIVLLALAACGPKRNTI